MFQQKRMLVLLASLVIGLSGCGGGSSGSSSSSGSSTGGSSTGGSSTGGSSTGGSSTGGSSTGGSSSGAITPSLSSVDFSKQVYIRPELDNTEESATALFFNADGNGSNYDNEGEGTFGWSITNDKMDIGIGSGGNINFALKSKVDNKYTFTITEPSGTFESEWFRALPLSIADLNGKILSIAASDDGCGKTLKFSPSSAHYKEVCPGDRGNGELTMALSTVSGVDNTIGLSWTDEEDNESRDLYLVMIEGSLNQSAKVAMVNIHDGVFNEVNITTLTLTDAEASEVAVTSGEGAFQVVDKKLIMTSETSDTGVNNKVLFGFDSTDDNPVYIVSLEADLSLVDSNRTGDARARIGFFQRLKSVGSDATVAEVFVAIDDRASGLVSSAFLTINGVDTAIGGIHRVALTKGESYHFKIDTNEDSENVVISFAGFTGTVAKSIFPSSNIYVSHANFHTRVKNAEAGNFAKASIDNLVLVRDKAGAIDTISLNFDDGVTPVANDEFNRVDF